MVDSNKNAQESNEMLLRIFVSAIGFDYIAHHEKKTAQVHPDFSEDTIALWHEIESRLKQPECLNFEETHGLSFSAEAFGKAARIIDNMPTVPAVNRWIPCSERLPELKKDHESNCVLCYCDTGAYAFSTLQENFFGQVGFACEKDDDYYHSIGKVIAWMPLPEPPKEDET